MFGPTSCSFVKQRGNIYLVGPGIEYIGKIASEAEKQPSNAVHEQLQQEDCRVVPAEYVSKRVARDGNHWHMTILTRTEMRSLTEAPNSTESCESVINFCQSFLGNRFEREKDWFALGVGEHSTEPGVGGGNNQCYFLVCCYPRATALRMKLGLPRKDFHITLGFKESDIHESDGARKGLESLIPNQPHSLVSTSSPSRILSKPSDLIEAARRVTLGGQPNEVVIDSEWSMRNRGRFQQANILLNAAESLINNSGGRGQSTNAQTPGELIFRFFKCHDPELSPSRLRDNMTLVRYYLHLRCQILGRKRDFDGVILHAEMLLHLKNQLKQELRANRTDSAIIACTALGYKGVALSMKKLWNDAHSCLLKSYQIYHDQVHQKSIAKYGCTRLNRLRKEEATAIERMLETSCTKIAREPPIPPLTRFPRTPHLFDTGGTAVSSDDLVLQGNSSCFRGFRNGAIESTFEEKVDGANLGLSLSATGEILAQNRSHYISGGEHHQYGPLKQWICEHHSSLKKILTAPDHEQRAASEGLILFGEWCVARHSLPYDKLPGYFIAFDLYDRRERKFYSRRRFHGVLRRSGIPCAPIIAVKEFGPCVYPGEKQKKSGSTNKNGPLESYLRLLLENQSRFRTDGGKIEGVVLRIDDADAKWLEHRVKVVRPDFVCGITGDWTRRAIEKQVVDPGFAERYCSTEDYSLAPSLPLPLPLPPASSKDPKNTTGEKGVDLLGNQGGPHGLSLGAVPEKTRAIDSSAEISRCHAPTGDGSVPATTVPSRPPRAKPGCSGKRNAGANSKSAPQAAWLKRRNVPRCIVCMGLPGSGKSTFATRLAASFPHETGGWSVLNQDRLGRRECEKLAGIGHREGARVILDRCNPTASERGRWLELMHSPPASESSLVYFAADAGVCARRVAERENHETIPRGKGERIVSDMAKKLEPPTAEERKRFGSIHFVRTFDDAETLLRSFGARGEMQITDSPK